MLTQLRSLWKELSESIAGLAKAATATAADADDDDKQVEEDS